MPFELDPNDRHTVHDKLGIPYHLEQVVYVANKCWEQNRQLLKEELMEERFMGDFGYALRLLKDGKACHRQGWNGKGMFIVLMPALYLPPYNTQDSARKVNDRTAKWIGEDTPLDCQPYFAMYTAQQKWQPGWFASQADMLAEDWSIHVLGAR